MKTKNTKYKNILMGAILALPVISMADVSVTTSVTGSANDVVGGGGTYAGKLTFAGTSQTIIVNSGTVQDAAGGGRHFDMGGTSNVFTFTGSSTQMIVHGTQNWSTGSTKISGTGNTLNLLAGATLTANGWNGLDGSGNTINIDGAGSKADMSADGGDGFGNTSGSDAYTTNRVNITNGGTLYVSGSGMANMVATTGAGNYAVNVDGAGGRSVLGISALIYNGAAQGGIAHIFNGGALETHGGIPNQFNFNAASPQKVFIDGGVISYRNASAAQMNESTAGNASSFTYAGNNAMRLNNSAATDTGSYTLANNLGAKNYTRLELVNGTTSVARVITVNGTSGGSILVDGTTATIANGVILSGAATITATGAASSITGVLSGSGSLVKEGTGTLTLISTESYMGDTVINAGTLSIGSSFLADASDIYVATGSFLNLNTSGATDTIDSFFLNGISQAVGVWGATGSGAQFETSFLTGTGKLNVLTAVPEPGTAVSLFGGLGMLLGLRRRRSGGEN